LFQKGAAALKQAITKHTNANTKSTRPKFCNFVPPILVGFLKDTEALNPTLQHYLLKYQCRNYIYCKAILEPLWFCDSGQLLKASIYSFYHKSRTSRFGRPSFDCTALLSIQPTEASSGTESLPSFCGNVFSRFLKLYLDWPRNTFVLND
jgi:hypothetical protein